MATNPVKTFYDMDDVEVDIVAHQLASARKLAVNLANTSTDTSFDGSQDQTGIKVSGTLPISNGGTGLTSSPSMLTNLGSTTAANVLTASPRPGVTGTLPIANGGTGATTKKAAEFAINGDMAEATAAMADNFQMVFSRVGSDQNATNGVFIYRQASTVWNYMKSKVKADSYAITASDINDIWNS